MVNLEGSEDPGYVAVRGRLCVWIKELEQEENGTNIKSTANDKVSSDRYREAPNFVNYVYGEGGKASQADINTGGGEFTWNS